MNRFHWRWLVIAFFPLILMGCDLRSRVGAKVQGVDTHLATPAPTISPAPTLDPAAISLGERLYGIHCASCHGADLEGEADWNQPNPDGSFRAPPHDASGHTWHHSDSLILEAVKKGGGRYPADLGISSPMPAFAEVLTETEIAAVIAFIKSRWPDDVRQTQWQVTSLECQASP